MVSVVMVAYRQQDLIERAIKGVIHQKAPFPIELIIADAVHPTRRMSGLASGSNAIRIL